MTEGADVIPITNTYMLISNFNSPLHHLQGDALTYLLRTQEAGGGARFQMFYSSDHRHGNFFSQSQVTSFRVKISDLSLRFAEIAARYSSRRVSATKGRTEKRRFLLQERNRHVLDV